MFVIYYKKMPSVKREEGLRIRGFHFLNKVSGPGFLVSLMGLTSMGMDFICRLRSSAFFCPVFPGERLSFVLGQRLEIAFPTRAPACMPAPQPPQNRSGVPVIPLSESAIGASDHDHLPSPPSNPFSSARRGPLIYYGAMIQKFLNSSSSSGMIFSGAISPAESAGAFMASPMAFLARAGARAFAL